MRIINVIFALFFVTNYSIAQVTDREGNTYQTVVIGKQTWMAENLNVSHFRNGDTIPEVKSNKEWLEAAQHQKPAWCYYKNKTKHGEKYGKLYNWFAVSDSRGLAPEGWHVATFEEWHKLDTLYGAQKQEFYNNGYDSLGFQLKSSTGWKKGNGSNSSGFTGLPGGLRKTKGIMGGFLVYTGVSFRSIRKWACWWYISPYHHGDFELSFITNDLYTFSCYKGHGLSVRCVKD
jgi:uncharacterized protein (TIGR02145 family)